MTVYNPEVALHVRRVLEVAERPLTVTEIADRAGKGIAPASISTVLIRQFDLGGVTRELKPEAESGTVLVYRLVLEGVGA